MRVGGTPTGVVLAVIARISAAAHGGSGNGFAANGNQQMPVQVFYVKSPAESGPSSTRAAGRSSTLLCPMRMERDRL